MSPSGGPSGTIVNMAMVYDSSADRMVVFGGTDFQGHGSDKTWAYDYESNTWTDRNPGTHPHAGWLDRAAYDSWAHRMIMFGGYDSVTKRFTNETWAYNYAGNNWKNLSAAGSPSPRTRPGLAFDSQSDRVILVGGETGFGAYSNETYSYNLSWNTWTNMSPDVHPEARRSSMMAYDSKADRMILFGGTDDGSPGYGHGAYNDTWAYDYETNTWTNLSSAIAPSPRYHGGFAYDSTVDRFVLYGGVGGDPYDHSPYETWLYDYDNNTWSQIAPDHSPSPKALMGMAFDTQSARTIMFGGNAGGNTPGNETWAFTAENPTQDSETDWTNMNPSDAPAGYLNMAMVYDSDADRMVAYGGWDGTDDFSNETWAYDLESNTWTNLHPVGHPDATHLLRAAYDSGSRQTILFGGWVGTISGGTYSNETWAYDFSSNTWRNLGPAEHPSGRSRQGMAYDAESARTILFGGHTIENTYDNETWAYDAAQNRWTNMAPAVAPPGRRSPGMTYDSKSDRMILFGGYDSYSDVIYNDTWAYDFDANTWTNMTPLDGPSGRWGMGFSYDSAIERCILFGGTADDSRTWAYDFTNNTWSLLRPHHSPPHHMFQGMAYDSQSARTIMFGGGGTPGNDTWALATAPGLPGAPNDVRIRPGNGYLELHWRAPPDDGLSPITGYRIYRSTNPGQEALFGELGNVDTWTDSNVTNGETYYYQLSAINAYGEGPRSGAVSAEPDGTPPVTSASLSGHLGNEGWWLSTVTVTLTASDDNSGVASTSFRVDGGGWQTYPSPIQVRGDGEHTVDFYSTDNAGNVEGWHSVGFRIDGTAPQTAISLDGAGGDGYWFHSPVTVDITATDAGSGVASIEYRLDGGTWATYAASFDVGEGEHTVDAYAIDVAGSSGPVVSRSFGVDTTPPITTAQIAGPTGENGWYLGAVQVTLAATDALGTPTIWVRVDGGSWTRYTGPLLFDTGVHTFDYYAVDASGLQEAVQTQTVSIDFAAPQSEASLQGTLGELGWYRSNVLLAIQATDATSGVASIAYRIDGGAWQAYAGLVPIGDGSHSIQYYATDSAGVAESVRVIEVRIDTTPPAVAAQSPSLPVTTTEVTISWTGTDAGSGIDHYEVRVDGGAYESVGGGNSALLRLADGSHTIEIRAVDLAGNEASTAITVTVDTSPPNTSGPYGATPLFAIVLAVIAIAFAVAVVVIQRRRRTV